MFCLLSGHENIEKENFLEVMSLFDNPLPPSCHLGSPFDEPLPPSLGGDVIYERPLSLSIYKEQFPKKTPKNILSRFNDLKTQTIFSVKNKRMKMLMAFQRVEPDALLLKLFVLFNSSSSTKKISM